MRPILEDPLAPWKKAAFTHRAKGVQTLRTERYRYTEWGGPQRTELYDHQDDPEEFHNVAEDADYVGVRGELAILMKAGWRAALPTTGA